MKYDYRFSLWPDEKWGFSGALFDVFRFMNTRVEMSFTEPEFESFRSQLAHDGFTLRGIVRIPHQEPEVVL